MRSIVLLVLVLTYSSGADVMTIEPGGNVVVAGSIANSPGTGEVRIGGGQVNAVGPITAGDVIINRSAQASGNQAVRSDDARLMPTGAVISFAGSVAPNGWLLCDGSLISRSQYSGLFSVIGSTYGSGDGSSTFNLPDLRSRVPVGGGQAPGLSARIVGQTGGEEFHTLTIDEMPPHSHQVRRNGSGTGGGPEPVFEDHWDGGLVNTSQAGKGQRHNVMQPYLVINYIIKN